MTSIGNLTFLRVMAWPCVMLIFAGCAAGRLDREPIFSVDDLTKYTVYEANYDGDLEEFVMYGRLKHDQNSAVIDAGDGSAFDNRLNLVTFQPAITNNISVLRSITKTIRGDVVIGVSRASDQGFVQKVLGLHPSGLWYLDERPDSAVDRCIEQYFSNGNLPALLSCLGFTDSDGGQDEELARLAEWQQPDCAGGNPVSEPSTPERFRQRARVLREEASDRERHGDRGGARLARIAANKAEVAAIAYEKWQQAVSEGAPADQIEAARQTAAEAAREYIDADNDFRDHEEQTRSPIPNPITGNNSATPDPRCVERETDSDRGTLFSNSDFCPDHNYLSCLRKENDVLFAATDEQCYRDYGPDDAPMVVCKPKDELTPQSPDQIGPQGPNTGTHTTDPNAPLNSRGQIETSYVSTTQFGAMILRLCSQGGCPDVN